MARRVMAAVLTPPSLGLAGTTVALLLLGLLLGIPAQGEIFTSSQDLREVFLVERNLVDALGKYLVKAETRLGRIRRYIQEYEAVKADVGWLSSDNLLDDEPWGRPTEGFIDMDSSSDVATNEGGAAAGGMPQLDDNMLDFLAGNPLHTFHLMKRLTVYWKHIDARVLKDEWEDVTHALFGAGGPEHPHVTLPVEDDLQGAAQALVRLHNVYGLNMSSLVRGDMWGIQSSAELTAQDCLYMGKHSFNLGYFSQSVEWFNEAYSLAGHEKNATVTQEQVAEFLNTAIRSFEESQAYNPPVDQQQENEHSLPHTDDIENSAGQTPVESMNSDAAGQTDSFPAVSIDMREDLPEGFEYNSPYGDEVNFFALCRGEKLLTPEQESQLHCNFDSRGSAYLLLMPAKVEHHHPSGAGLVTFHEVISEEEIELIKELAHPVMARAMVQGVEGKGNTISSTRTSKVAWLDDPMHPVVERLGIRIQELTGLSTDQAQEHAEMLQVANYGIGGHYNPHHDYLLVDKTPEELANINPREMLMGDRVATFMFYLSDVIRGGATAFPRLGVAVWPARGSAAFWYNIKRSGAPDEHTLHGACPVVHGSKWVSNKWIRERGQISHRPCSLNPRE